MWNTVYIMEEFFMSNTERGRAKYRRSDIDIFYVSIVGVLVLLLVLVVSVIIMFFKISSFNKTVRDLNAQIASESSSLKEDLDSLSAKVDDHLNNADISASYNADNHSVSSNASSPSSAESSHSGTWIDLSNHPEITVQPESFFDSYKTYYVNSDNGVFIRSGPGVTYDKVTAAEAASEVYAAAATAEWTFVKFGNKFGWIKSVFLSVSVPTF